MRLNAGDAGVRGNCSAGTSLDQLAACFVLPLEDSLDGIFTTLHDAALIQQTGGGVGYDFSHLRPSGDRVTATGGASSGPVPFMTAFNAAVDAVRQGGRRRGANMAVLDVHHPDIESFITAKRVSPALRNFNLSVGVDDAFMHAARHGGEITLLNPRTGQAVAGKRAAEARIATPSTRAVRELRSIAAARARARRWRRSATTLPRPFTVESGNFRGCRREFPSAHRADSSCSLSNSASVPRCQDGMAVALRRGSLGRAPGTAGRLVPDNLRGSP